MLCICGRSFPDAWNLRETGDAPDMHDRPAPLACLFDVPAPISAAARPPGLHVADQ